MRIEIEARAGRVLRLGDERYFLLRHQGALHAVPDACPHRGGPLSKGTCDERRQTITCPMHGLKTPVRSLLAKALPAVQVGGRMVVVVP